MNKQPYPERMQWKTQDEQMPTVYPDALAREADRNDAWNNQDGREMLDAEAKRVGVVLPTVIKAALEVLSDHFAAQADQIKRLEYELSCIPQAVRAWFVGQYKIKEASK